MIFRLLRLFFLRFLPRRLFALVSLVEFVLLARRFYRATAIPKRPTKPKLVLRPIEQGGPDEELSDARSTPRR